MTDDILAWTQTKQEVQELKKNFTMKPLAWQGKMENAEYFF